MRAYFEGDMTELLKRNPLFSGLDEAGLAKVKGITSPPFL